MSIKTYKKSITLGTVSLIASALLVGCGGGTSSDTALSTSQRADSHHSGGSNIPYLRDNHANYSQHGSNLTPAPVKDADKKSIDWTISADTEEGAIKLTEHINFMLGKLQAGENPRGWDKLFLMEAYMKVNHYYTTTVERSGTDVVISKVATTPCAYNVISAHSDAVSGDFFGKGVIDTDYSTTAEEILAGPACSNEKSSIEKYINENQKTKGM